MRGRVALGLVVLAFVAAAIAVAVVGSGGAGTAHACTGGIADLEWFAPRSGVILIARAVEVGDAVNHAPPVTLTPTATQTPAAVGTRVARYPVALPSATPTLASAPVVPEFDLTGLGATFRVLRVIAGEAPAEIPYLWDTRASIEQTLRRWEAGSTGEVSSCPLGAFIPRYQRGVDYLLFFMDGADSFAWASFPIAGDSLVLNDEGHLQAGNGYLRMSPETRARYFDGTEEGQTLVPIEMMLRAVAALRGDATIAPPDAGNAGLKR